MPRKGNTRRSKKKNKPPTDTKLEQLKHLCKIGDLETVKILYDRKERTFDFYDHLDLADIAVKHDHLEIFMYILNSSVEYNSNMYTYIVNRILSSRKNSNNIKLLKCLLNRGDMFVISNYIADFSSEDTILEICKDPQYFGIMIEFIYDIALTCCHTGKYRVVTYLIDDVLKMPKYELSKTPHLPETIPPNNESYENMLSYALSSSSAKLCKYFIEEKKVLDVNKITEELSHYEDDIEYTFATDNIHTIAYLFQLGYKDTKYLRKRHIAPLLNLGVNFKSMSMSKYLLYEYNTILDKRTKRQNAISNIALSCTNLVFDTISIINQYTEYN